MRLFFAALGLALTGAAAPGADFDLVIYGATPGGIAAAVHAAQSSSGLRIALVEPSPRLGGMLTGGLAYMDFRSQASVQGFLRDYMNRVVQHYTRAYGEGSEQVRDSFQGAHAEPSVSLHVLEAMLAEHRNIEVLRESTILSTRAQPGPPRVVESITIARAGAEAAPRVLNARFFIDASYEGDLAAAAGFPFRVGRESTREFGERLAGKIYYRKGVVLDGSTGEGDHKLQCYNFRVIMTQRDDLGVAVARPASYDPTRYRRLAEAFARGELAHAFTLNHDGVLRIQRIANGKADINDINTSPIGFGLPGENWDYPEATPARRREIHAAHRHYAMGLLYYLQNDPSVPEAIRREASTWKLAKDEFVESGHFPTALYVREARRFLGDVVFTEHGVRMDPGTKRSRLVKDSVAIGDYVINSHGVDAPRDPYPDVREGYVAFGTVPYQVPYGVMIPKDSGNMLIPVALSASHIGFCALRLEPVWAALGQAAGIAASLLLANRQQPHQLPVAALQEELHRRGAISFYASDIAPHSADFAMVQRLGNLGYFHEPQSGPAPERRVTYGLQYSDAPAYHQANLATPLSAATWRFWNDIARRQPDSKPLPEARPGETRGEFLRRTVR